MRRRGYRYSPAPSNKGEQPHPYLGAMFPLGDLVNEPFALSWDSPYQSGVVGTIVDGAWQGGYARQFNVGGNYIRIHTYTGFWALPPYTAMFFINLTAPGSIAYLFASTTHPTYCSIEISSTYIKVYKEDSVIVAQAAVSLQGGVWYHIAITGDSTGHTMYLNGSALNLSINLPARAFGSNYSYLVGQVVNNAICLDHVKLYIKVLSQNEINQEMNKRVW